MSEPVASPCTKVCVIEPRSGWCEGCMRTLSEIAAWGAISDGERLAICKELPARRERSEQLRAQSPPP